MKTVTEGELAALRYLSKIQREDAAWAKVYGEFLVAFLIVALIVMIHVENTHPEVINFMFWK